MSFDEDYRQQPPVKVPEASPQADGQRHASGRHLAACNWPHAIWRPASASAAALADYRPLLDIAEVRLHDTPLYNSIYRFDNEMLVNVHAYGLLAAYTPVFHLRRVDGQWFETYIESYERVWATARPYNQDEAA